MALAVAAGSLLLAPAVLVSIPRYDFARLAHRRPAVTEVMRDVAAEALADGATVHRSWQWIPLAEMSPWVAPAFVAALDPRFHEHAGIDLRGIRAELGDAWETRALPDLDPTISRRLVRELVLGREISAGERTAEWILTRRLERKLSKERVLEVFLNVAHWEGEIYGVEEAARKLLGKSVRDLDLREAACLAAMFPTEGVSDLGGGAHRLKRAVVRTNLILKRMERAGVVTSDEFEASRASAR